MEAKLINRLTWKDVKEIVNTTESVVDTDEGEEKYYSNVIRALNLSNKTPLACKERYKFFKAAMEKVSGDKLANNRTFEQVVYRSIIANQLREEGYTFESIGKAMGRDHSTVVFYIDKMKTFASLPIMFEKELQLLRMFNDEINLSRQ